MARPLALQNCNIYDLTVNTVLSVTLSALFFPFGVLERKVLGN